MYMKTGFKIYTYNFKIIFNLLGWHFQIKVKLNHVPTSTKAQGLLPQLDMPDSVCELATLQPLEA